MSTTWTPDAVRSEFRRYHSKVWRLVEAQHRSSTIRIADSLDEQELIERLIEEVKPPLPKPTQGLYYLLATPFRYRPTRPGSRFRRQDQAEGVFYAAEHVETCVAEMAFHRLLFFAESPGTPLPANPVEFTAFQIGCATDRMVDLTTPPFDRDQAMWSRLDDYDGCQLFALTARQSATEVIRYRSVRDPGGRANVALLSPAAFDAVERSRGPDVFETWRLYVRPTGVQAMREFPYAAVEYPVSVFGDDHRIAAFTARTL